MGSSEVELAAKSLPHGSPSHKIEIRITDNGLGIPEEIRGKIFQPFFTTKPTGEGTGLGLSLAYDIIKAHGGTITVSSFNGPHGGVPIAIGIQVESRESEARLSRYSSGGLVGQGSEFIIRLPV